MLRAANPERFGTGYIRTSSVPDSVYIIFTVHREWYGTRHYIPRSNVHDVLYIHYKN